MEKPKEVKTYSEPPIKKERPDYSANKEEKIIIFLYILNSLFKLTLYCDLFFLL